MFTSDLELLFSYLRVGFWCPKSNVILDVFPFREDLGDTDPELRHMCLSYTDPWEEMSSLYWLTSELSRNKCFYTRYKYITCFFFVYFCTNPFLPVFYLLAYHLAFVVANLLISRFPGVHYIMPRRYKYVC